MKRTLIAIVVLLGLATGGSVWLLCAPLPVNQQYLLEVMPGTHLEGMLKDLDDLGGLGKAPVAWGRRLLARAYARVSRVGTHLQVGEYPVQPGDTLLNLLQRLEQGTVKQRAFMLVDGWSFRQVRAALAKAPALEHKLDDMTNAEIAKTLGLQQPVEGWLAPNTYFYTAGGSDIDILRRALARQQQLLNVAWGQRASDLPFKSPYDALIMASLVEKETAAQSEMPEIAGVFVNRLEKGMKLQTDPTVIYALGAAYRGRIGYRDLRIDSPYNTYLHYGLPPTPIAMPSQLAIAAALHPAHTDNLYFVAKGDGTHVFSRTLTAHNAAVREFQLHRQQDYRSTPAATSQGAAQ